MSQLTEDLIKIGPEACQEVLLQLAEAVDAHNKNIKRNNCMPCTRMKSYCANCEKCRTKPQKPVSSKQEYIPEIRAIVVGDPRVQKQENEIHKLILAEVNIFSEKMKKAINNSKVIAPDVGTVVEDTVIILGEPLICEVYMQMRKSYARCGITLSAIRANQKVVKVSFGY